MGASILGHPTFEYDHEDFQTTIRVLIEQGQYDPMALSSDGCTPLHFYEGPLETFEYIINQQNHFCINLEEKANGGQDVIEGMLVNGGFHGAYNMLHLINHLLEAGHFEDHADRAIVLFITLARSMPHGPLSTSRYASKPTRVNDLVFGLASIITRAHRRKRCKYLTIMLAYGCTGDESPAEYEENDKTSLIRLWVNTLKIAKLDLHEHFRDVKRTLDQHRVLDGWHHREGIKRELRVEFGSDSDDVTILVRDVKVEIPPERCIPGAWNVGETLYKTGLVAKGLEPTANWRVSSKEIQSAESST